MRKTFKEKQKKKLKLAIIGMPKTTLVEVANSTREIEEKMPTPRRSRWYQPLSTNENLDEESSNEYKKINK